MRKIGIFKHQLFKYSETFIHAQVSQLKEFHPIYIGRDLMGDIPAGFETIVPFKTMYQKYVYTILNRPNIFIKELQKKNISLLHAYFGMDAIYALEISRKLNLPLVTTFLGFDATTKNWNFIKTLKPTLIRYSLSKKRLIASGNIFLCYSNFLKEQLIMMGFPEKKLLTHYVGIDCNLDSRELNSYSNGNKIVLLHVGRLVEKKGTEYLIQAMSVLKNKSYDCELIIIGDGPLKSKLRQLTKHLRLEEHITFLGAQPNEIVIDWMRKAYLFCLPSVKAKDGDSEGLGFVFLESQARGLPVVATNHGGIPEAVRDNYSGFLCEERNISDLAEKIAFFIDHPVIRKQCSKNSMEFIRNEFDVSKQTMLLESVYNSLI